MRKFYYVLAICLIVASCDKDESLKQSNFEISKRELNKSEIILRDNLKQTAKIVANLVQDKEIINELRTISAESRAAYKLSFEDLLAVPDKGICDSFKILREKFLQGCISKGTAAGDSDLARYLVENKCYLYCPYPDDFYPDGITNYTVAAHPIDNEYEGVGYIIDGSGRMTETIIDEKYTDKNPVLLIMPKNKDESEDLGFNVEKSTLGAKGDTVNEVTVGLIRCASFCGGLFEGTLELRIGRGYPNFNSETEVVTGTFTAVIPIDYPKDYAKAAINNWTVHSNGGWYPVNVIWDSNWKITEVQQGIIAYEYDQSTTVSASATVGYKKDPYSATQTATATTTYRGDFLGINEWDRTWFYLTNTNPGPSDVVKDGWVARQTSTVLKLITPTRTLY
jgi:hypothetical protein